MEVYSEMLAKEMEEVDCDVEKWLRRERNSGCVGRNIRVGVVVDLMREGSTAVVKYFKRVWGSDWGVCEGKREKVCLRAKLGVRRGSDRIAPEDGGVTLTFPAMGLRWVAESEFRSGVRKAEKIRV